jgi:hypothetical protein
MLLSERLAVAAKLGQYILAKDEHLQAFVHRTSVVNPWFTIENQEQALLAIAQQFLDFEKLTAWAGGYAISEQTITPPTLGLVLAGNIPLVGFHDVLCTFISGSKAKIKLSEKDPFLLPHLVQVMIKMDEQVAAYFDFTDRLQGYTAVIATGSNNSSRYFEAYFGKYPHIIRKNRNAIAVLSGKETAEELHRLGQDVFQYFGLGCRNVSKLYLPIDYDFTPLLETFHEDYKHLVLNNKYKNNYDYNYAFLMLNKVAFQANGCLLLTEENSLTSRIANVHYEFYPNLEWMETEIAQRKEEIQCVVARPGFLTSPTLDFGTAQHPDLSAYADGVDTLSFLLSLPNGE